MKRIILFAIICTLVSVFFADKAYSIPYPPDVDLVSIEFNYYTYAAVYDALNIQKNFTTSIHRPEWESGYNEPMAYIRNQSPRKIEAVFYADWYSHEDMLIWAYKISGSGIGNVNSTWVSFEGHTSDPTLMTCGSSVPGTVGIREFSWRWYLLQIDDFEYEIPILIGDSGDHKFYTVLAQPQDPMDTPWTEALDYACAWASGTNNESDALEVITEEAYTDMGVDHEYSGLEENTHAVGQTFDLTGFFEDYYGDCRDISALVHVFTRAIGGTQTQVRMINTTSTSNWFYCQPIKPFGENLDWTDGYTRWWFHQVAWKSAVYDPCIRLDEGGTERIAVDEPITEGESYYNDLYYDGYNGQWLPQTPKDYTTVY